MTESHFAVTLNSKRTKLVHNAGSEMEGMIQEVNNGEGENAMVDLSPFIDRSTLTVQVGFPMSKVYTYVNLFVFLFVFFFSFHNKYIYLFYIV